MNEPEWATASRAVRIGAPVGAGALLSVRRASFAVARRVLSVAVVLRWREKRCRRIDGPAKRCFAGPIDTHPPLIVCLSAAAPLCIRCVFVTYSLRIRRSIGAPRSRAARSRRAAGA
ncbi:hypothetical protein LV178_24830, partial [Burkholderia mallei]|nr:hypothetical protein [Burkholderia mallei]